jgi:histidine triad (HIT) family protein
LHGRRKHQTITEPQPLQLPTSNNHSMPTLFSKIIAKEIPAKIVYEDQRYLVIEDIDPQAPVHVLVIPKKEIATLNDLTPADAELVGGMFLVAAKVMKQLGQTDYRTVFNCGPGAQQSVFHLHLHVLAGRKFTWPPG